MSDKSKIEWTQATWNPTTGCNKVSPGCKNCYAERDWKRLSANPASVYYGRSFTDVKTHPERLEQVLNWKKPRMIFVNSMSDLFHQDIPFEFIDEVFATMALCTQHTFQILTKRPDRMLEWSKVAFQTFPTVRCLELGLEGENLTATGYDDADHRWQWPLKNVWLGVSVENQGAANERIPLLSQTPAAIRWISAEPLLGSLDLASAIHRINWVVAGGESGPNARPSHPDWFRGLRHQCIEAKVPFFFKQWGNWGLPYLQKDAKEWAIIDAHSTIKLATEPRSFNSSGSAVMCRLSNKRLTGRELDGRTWDQMPS